MHFDSTLHKKSKDLILSDDGLTLTNTKGVITPGFAQPALSSGRHAWEVTLGKQDKDPGWCCIGVGDAGCAGTCIGVLPQTKKLHTIPKPGDWGSSVATPFPRLNTAALAEGARFRVVVDLDHRTLAFSLNGGELHRMDGVELPASVRPYVVFAGHTEGATLRLSGYDGSATTASASASPPTRCCCTSGSSSC